MKQEKRPFVPYVPADKVMPEITVTSVLTGIVLAVVFGSANAYLGLRVGLTVSASVPAAVISMGIIRMGMKRNSILESNMVQTIGSAGESLAAGAIFTLPAIFLWAKEGILEKPGWIEITLIALIGGLLGVFFMIPLREALIVREHAVLPYPEGTACAEVLLTGEEAGAGSSTVFAGMGISAFFKFIIDGLKLISGEVSFAIKGFFGEIGIQIYPAVMSVGYICGPKISSYMFAGGVLSWLVFIPLIVLFGREVMLYPATVTVGELFDAGGAGAVWSAYIRYIGAGALATGGMISLIKTLPLIMTAFRKVFSRVFKQKSESVFRTEQEFDVKIVLSVILVLTVSIWLIPSISVSLTGAVLIALFGFFFAAVSSRMVGLVGSSNNPISGMAIAVLLITSLIQKLTGREEAESMQYVIAAGSMICIIAAIAGDTSQDLKTGYLLGATPKKQQIGEIVGVVAAAMAIGRTMSLLDRAWGFGSQELAAPQAMLMKLIVEGVLQENLPWELILIGVFVALTVEIAGIPVLPFAIGVYLPVQLNACIMAGGAVRFVLERLKCEEQEKNRRVNHGILYCSGMIAGEGLVGILLAVCSIFGIDRTLNCSSVLSKHVADAGSLVAFAVILVSVLAMARSKKRNEDAK